MIDIQNKEEVTCHTDFVFIGYRAVITVHREEEGLGGEHSVAVDQAPPCATLKPFFTHMAQPFPPN